LSSLAGDEISILEVKMLARYYPEFTMVFHGLISSLSKTNGIAKAGVLTLTGWIGAPL
jgi:hypothetical protein